VRVLVVEDKVKLATLLSRGLRKEGLSADISTSGEEALWMAASAPYDAVILDVMLPGIDGFETCRRLRDEGVWSPVLMLTARGSVDDRVAGLDSGADDYLTKPFSLRELLARLRALMRRGAAERPAVLEVGDLRLDPASRRVWRGEVLTRLDLLEAAWDQSYENRSNIVDAYVRRLRQKMDRPFSTHTLETVRGAGYRLREEAA
jgi:two-component system OmpR family response regulator